MFKIERVFPSLWQCGGTTHVLRLSWSPDGQYLVSAHAMNNSGPTAQIVERDGWRTNMDFVGHRKAVTVVVRKVFKLKTRYPSCALDIQVHRKKLHLKNMYEQIDYFLAEIQPEDL